MDPDDPDCQLAWGMACDATGDSDQAVATFETIVHQNPSMAEVFFHLGTALAAVNRPAEAIPCLERAIQLSPQDMWMREVLFSLALAHVAAEQPEEALGLAQQSVHRKPDYITGHLILVGCYAGLELITEARATIEELLRLSPGFTLTGLRPLLSGWDPPLVERVIQALRKAGLPN